MRVKVPSNIAGGSLMGAHRFVKSALARTNPGGSTSNYKLQATDGTPITLSDLTTQQYDEILVISGVRNNPSTYPVVDPDFDYPSYTSRNIVGNDLARLLPKDIDGGMLERLSAEVGTFSALNTIARLMYTNEVESATSPDVAAVLQRYANASRQLTPRSNPGRPFFARELNDTYRGILSPEEATKAFASDQLGVRFPQDTPTIAKAIDKAKIVRTYGLTDRDVNRFVDDVLTPYLAVSSSNANLLKALRSTNARDDMMKALKRAGFLDRIKGQATDGSMEQNQLFKKMVALTPTKAEQFYDGVDYAFIANPVFMRSSLAASIVDGNNKLLNHLMDTTKRHPRGGDKAVVADQMPGKIGGGTTFLSFITDRLIADDYKVVKDMALAQSEILQETDPSRTMELLKEIYDSKTRDEDIIKYIRKMDSDKLVVYTRDLAGFRPTAPPYWPKPVALALMDTIKDNWDVVSSPGPSFSTVFLGLRTQNEDEEFVIGIIGEDNGEEFKLSLNLKQLENATRFVTVLSPQDYEILIPNYGDIELPEETEISKFTDYKSNLNAEEKEELKLLIKAITRDSGMEYQDDRKDELDMLKAIMMQGLMASKEESQVDNIKGPRVVSLLSLFMEIEDRARNQYNYSMSENDRAFALYLLEGAYSLLDSNTTTEIGTIEDLKQEIAVKDDTLDRQRRVMADMQVDGRQLSVHEIQGRIDFETNIRGMEAQFISAINDGEDVTVEEVAEHFEGIRNVYNENFPLPRFAEDRITEAIGNINLEIVNREYFRLPEGA